MLVSLKLPLMASFAVCLSACAVQAQSDMPRPATGAEAAASARAYPIRVESSMSINVPVLAGASAEEQLKLTEATRVSLYQAAARECENLKQVFNSDCRLQNVRINSNVQSRSGSRETMHVNIASSYEVTNRRN